VKIKKLIVTLIVIIGVVLLVTKGKGLLEKRRAQVENEALPQVEEITVPAVKSIQGKLQNKVAFLAKIDSDKSIKLSTKLAGYVEKVYVEESQKVKKGTLLVRIDAVELKSNMAALKITQIAQQNDFELAKSIHARNQKLYRVGGLAKEKLELSEVGVKMKRSALKSTSSKLAQLQHQLTYLTIKAPFDGEVDAIMMHEGDLAATGKPILSMSNGAKKLLFSYAPTKDVQIDKAQSVLFQEEVVGTVKSIYTTSSNGLITAEVALNKKIYLPVGSSISIEVITKEATGCIVPDNAILHKKEGTFVMIYQEDKFVPLKVNVEMQEGNKVLISSCPTEPIAQASEVKLAQLPAYSKVNLTGVTK
jgi:RND family efflux transporter MFP subunit